MVKSQNSALLKNPNYIPMISLKHINKQYSTRDGVITALKDVSLDIAAGEIVGIIGKSGAGKSTLARCINLLERPSSGQVMIDNQDLMSLSPTALRKARREIGMIFQHFNLLATRTVYDNIAFPLELAGYSKQKIHEQIMPLIEMTGLIEKKNFYPAQLSGGQKQRVGIARALASKPKVLLSDEATSALDPETTAVILQLLKNIRDTLKLTIVLITHEMTAIKACCDRVAILQHGELIETNEIGEFFAHPKTAIAKNFIAASLPQYLPLALENRVIPQQQANTHAIWRLWFVGHLATQPIITQLINQFGLRINILQANVEYIKNHIMGIMLIAVDGEKNNMAAGFEHLKQIEVQAEIIGYISNDIIPFN